MQISRIQPSYSPVACVNGLGTSCEMSIILIQFNGSGTDRQLKVTFKYQVSDFVEINVRIPKLLHEGRRPEGRMCRS